MYMYRKPLNAWALPQCCSVEGSHSESNVVATLHSIGKINKGIREYLNPTPFKLYIPLGRSTKLLGNIKIPPPLYKLYIQFNIREYYCKSPPPLHFNYRHSIGKINKGTRENLNPTPVKLYIQLG